MGRTMYHFTLVVDGDGAHGRGPIYIFGKLPILIDALGASAPKVEIGDPLVSRYHIINNKLHPVGLWFMGSQERISVHFMGSVDIHSCANIIRIPIKTKRIASVRKLRENDARGH